MGSNGGAVVIKALKDLGVKYVFGIPGVHNMHIYDELESSRM